MYKQLLCGLISCTILTHASAEYRTWTNSDGTKTFKGEFQSQEGDKITVKMHGGKKVTFSADMLSEADLEWIKLAKEQQELNAKQDAEVAKYANSKMGTALSKKKLKILESKRFASYEMTKSPEYFLLYFSASW
ncbi:hypothetical protein [Persicirhabdus sediminis]|uniref:SLA1 homology domain-containing protein n=1 Tax=Persicirhabdus sediminis TaxID=454144 RepID=A0A8J7MB60_9BACT|nr:hypothetical protein [Persicirhabdus sediminis]MBK1789882.1 hypothetical protein [Persicirhabdus sediminis]